MKNITKIVLYFSFVILAPWLADASTGYCDKGLCLHGYTQMAAEHKKLFDKKCPSDAKLLEITTTLHDFIVEQFNEKRNFVAGGNLPEFPEPACRMGTMKWDKELAELAELDVKQCDFTHDCHNIESYHSTGQIVTMLTYLKCNRATDTKKYIKSVGMWYDQVEFIQPSVIQRYPEFFEAPSVGHFTSMVLERNVAIGCAASTYSAKGTVPKSYLVACNFAYIKNIGRPTYKTCKTPGKECKTGKNPKYPNLCSTSEKYDVKHK